ncbi:YraN family protein [Bradymonadaceae bacterium TMQ3]|nr:YraN family protein [Bradymonadaceae bacterium TMQ3]TXC76565.1 YraN family protein [Bradymonadales bacterium TMQ1]
MKRYEKTRNSTNVKGETMSVGSGDWIERDDVEQLGLAGEALARAYLEQKGWSIEAQNVRSRYGELDLVACKARPGEDPIVAFVEVKSRRRCDRFSPTLAVSYRKRRTIARLAHRYICQRRRTGVRYRFDVITVDFGKRPAAIVHIEGAFDAQGNTC